VGGRREHTGRRFVRLWLGSVLIFSLELPSLFRTATV
jgi:hypothetical protein